MALADRLSKTSAARLDRIIEAYEPLPGVLDECLDSKGAVRPHWLRFFEGFADLSSSELDQRFNSADRHMRDTGIFFRAYGETAERPWPLSHVPVLIDGDEWAGIAAGVVQRARLAEAVLADIHGPKRFVGSGALTAAMIAGSPDFLHPIQGVIPAGGRFLSIFAVDLGRGPDGRWCVLGDRTQAPSGAGYALENRLALTRAFADLHRVMNVERLAPFFQSFRNGMAAQAERSDPRICLLTPGPLSQTYFEHAYLARYLGFLLVEGGDLVVRDKQVHVRTIAGLKRADVLLRRVDADFADPLELDGRSRLGVPGLVEAIRASSVAIANALGSGLIEGRALMSALPGLARAAIGEDLILPSVATHWCGTPEGRDHVLKNLDSLILSGAFRDRLPDLDLDQPTPGADLDEARRERLKTLLTDRGIDYAAQDIARLSTTPVWDGKEFVARPFVLRVFAAATRDGWHVMPGGFCRIANTPDARAMSLSTADVQSADVWILSKAPVEATSLIPSSGDIRIRRILGNLPSRAADNLFWLGRYLERTECTLRMVRCLCIRSIEAGSSDDRGHEAASQRLLDLLRLWGAAAEANATGMPPHHLAGALHDADRSGSALSLAREVQRTASTLRERLSRDTTRLIDLLVLQLASPSTGSTSESDVLERSDAALRLIAAISGLSQENINRVAGWRFLEMGRRLERAIATCRFGRVFAGETGPAENLDVLLDLIDSQITYRSRYLSGVALYPIRDMALLDPYNPRSVAFQIERLAEHIESLPVMREDGLPEQPRRLVLALVAAVTTADASSLDGAAVDQMENDLLALGGAIAIATFYRVPLRPVRTSFRGLRDLRPASRYDVQLRFPRHLRAMHVHLDASKRRWATGGGDFDRYRA